MSSKVTLTAWPSVGLVDDKLVVVASGLTARQSVTIVVLLTDSEFIFLSYGQFYANDDGRVDPQTASSNGGTYIGVEPMGLLWSMRPAEGQRRGIRLMKKNVEEPFVIEMYLVDGHVEISRKDDIQQFPILDRICVKRYYQMPGVVAFPVRDGSLRGMLFLPPGRGPFPGVIDMFGTAGGLTLYRAALLASRGFVSLSLAYFDYDDLPPSVELDLEYFKVAADWLHSRPFVLKRGIGVVGVSKGAALAMQMAVMNDKVRAIVAINPYCCHCIGIHYCRGQRQPVVNADLDDLYETNEGLIYGKAFQYKDNNRPAIIQVDKAENAHFLFVVGGDDATCDARHLEILEERLKTKNKANYHVLSYPGAGHLIEPPFTPHFRTCYTKLIGMVAVYGGETKAHALAQEDSWKQITRFLRFHLTQQPGEKRTYRPSSQFCKI